MVSEQGLARANDCDNRTIISPVGWNILVMRDGGHDKFWAYQLGSYLSGEKVKCRWGKIGTIGVEVFYNGDDVWSKVQEKFRKGYRKATQEEMDKFFDMKTLLMWEV